MNAAQRSELEALARELMKEHEIPGVAIGIREGCDETIVTLGSAGDDPPREVGPSTIFKIGSVTKTFTALALMRKVEDGVLDLDAPLQRYLPKFTLANSDWAERITPRHLLTHTASWEGDHTFEERAKYRGADALERVVELIPRIPLHTAPGTLFHYSNLAFSVAGRLLEVLHGTSFERAIKELVLDPLGLEDVFFDPERRPAERSATGHPKTEFEVPRSDWPAGGIQCDIRAMLRYACAHLASGIATAETQIRKQTLAAMWTPLAEMDHRPQSVGLCWMLDTIDGCRVVSHGGAVPGQVAVLELIPERDFALIALANSEDGGSLLDGMIEWSHERLMGLSWPTPEYIRLSKETLQQYTGAYSRPAVVWHIEPRVGAPDGGLALRGSDQWEWACGPIDFLRPDVFQVSDGPLHGAAGTFVRGEDGEVRWLRWWGHRLHERRAQ